MRTIVAAAALAVGVFWAVGQIAQVMPAQASDAARTFRPAVGMPTTGTPAGRIVVKFADGRRVDLVGGRISGELEPGMEALLASHQAAVSRRLVRTAPETIRQSRRAIAASAGRELPDLTQYFVVDVDDWSRAPDLIVALNARADVEVAYYEPPAEPSEIAGYNVTPDFEVDQTYLDSAPGGVDARAGWVVAGGMGDGVRIVHVEGAWRTTHEDMSSIVGGAWTPTVINSSSWRNHGSAVIGEMVGDSNGFGVTGIAYEAAVGLVSIDQLSVAEGIHLATDSLEPGDCIVLTMHRPGPRYGFQPRADQLGYIALEYWPAEFDAIQIAAAKGIVVCEAAGNGAENLDDPIYGGAFDPALRHSGAILCGAGAPSSGSFGPDRSRLGFSNHGLRVDLQGYGAGVVTTGYGTLHSGAGEDEYYTATFSGTSSATPVVGGVVAVIEGVYRAQYGEHLPPMPLREMLVATGSAQQGDTSEHIGPRPDIAAALAVLPAPGPVAARPSLVATRLTEGDSVSFGIHLVNRVDSAGWSFDVAVVDSFSFTAGTGHVSVTPTGGALAAGDSVLLTVSVTTLGLEPLTGYDRARLVIAGDWGGDSVVVPVFVEALCAADTTYAVAASDTGGAARYDWLDVASVGVMIPSGDFHNTSEPSLALDDGTAGPFVLTMPFAFYDSTYTTVYVGVNGAISFSDSEVNVDGYFGRLAIPQDEIAAFVPVLWNDLVIDPGFGHGSIHTYQSAAGDTFAVEWHQVGNFGDATDTLTTFELLLLGGRRIVAQYQSVGTGTLGEAALIGLDDGGCRFEVYATGTDSVSATDFLTVVFHRGDDPLWIPGDANGDGSVNLLDVVALIDYLYRGGAAPEPLGRGELDCVPGINLLDVVALIDYLFREGSPPCSGSQAIRSEVEGGPATSPALSLSGACVANLTCHT